MGANQGDTLNWDSNNKKTSSYKGDPGDGSDVWYGNVRAVGAGDNGEVLVAATPYPDASTPVIAGSGNVANASAAATMAAVVGKTNYCTGFEVTGAGATAAANVALTLAGLLGGTRTWIVTAPAGATAPITPLVVQFDPPLPASAANVALTLTLPALGAGNTHAAVVLHGYYR